MNPKAIIDFVLVSLCGISRETILAHLDMRMASDEMPLLNVILEKIKDTPQYLSVKNILSSLEFKFEDFCGTTIANYFKRIRTQMIRALKRDRNMPTTSIAKLFAVSKSYVYKVINSV